MTIYFQRLSVTSERQRWSKFGIQDALSCLSSFSIFALLKNGMEINRPDAITIIVSERHRIIPSCLFIFLSRKYIFCTPFFQWLAKIFQTTGWRELNYLQNNLLIFFKKFIIYSYACKWEINLQLPKQYSSGWLTHNKQKKPYSENSLFEHTFGSKAIFTTSLFDCFKHIRAYQHI